MVAFFNVKNIIISSLVKIFNNKWDQYLKWTPTFIYWPTLKVKELRVVQNVFCVTT